MADVKYLGAHVQDELDVRGWSAADLADVMGVTTTTTHAILYNEEASIDMKTMRLLGAALNKDAVYWINKWSEYQLERLHNKPGDPDVIHAVRERAIAAGGGADFGFHNS